MNYRLEISETAQKYLKSLSLKSRRLITRRIDALAESLRPHGCEQLKGSSGLFRIRSGDYRIIYALRDDVLLVTVICIDLRDKIYKIIKRLQK